MTGIASGSASGLVRYGQPAGRWVLLATVLGSGLTFLDATVVNIALPSIGSTFHADAAALQWTINGYTLSLASLILLGGSLGDRFGRRRIFVIGVAWFAASSLLCGLAPNVESLIASAAPCSRPVPSPSSKLRSILRIGGRPSAPGPGWAVLPERSARSSPVGGSSS